jgi:hypothetical protein
VVVSSVPCRVVSEVHIDGTCHGRVQNQQELGEVIGAKRARLISAAGRDSGVGVLRS